MAQITTWTWTVNNLNVMPSLDGQTNVVVNVFYTLTGSDESQSANVRTNQVLTYTNGSAFTAFSNLTQSEVIGWVQSALGQLGISALEAQVQAQLDAKENPVVTPIFQALPWIA